MLEDQPSGDFITGETRINPNWNNWFSFLTQRINHGIPPGTTQELSAASQIAVNADLMRVKGSTPGTTTLTNPIQMSASDDGKSVKIVGASDTHKVKVVNGNGFKLVGGADFEMGDGDVIDLHHDTEKNLWIENYRNNN